ncbi:MAG: hypothetical protein D6741_08145 [Planctomycetota bacterium]|nr:MAG: hypothetical protein D6741_08145 [Planctomycetota bacterium]
MSANPFLSIGIFELIIVFGIFLVLVVIPVTLAAVLLSGHSSGEGRGFSVVGGILAALLIFGIPIAIGAVFLWGMRVSSQQKVIMNDSDDLDRSLEWRIEPVVPSQGGSIQKQAEVTSESPGSIDVPAPDASEPAEEVSPDGEEGDAAPAEDTSNTPVAEPALPTWVGAEPKMIDGAYVWPISVGPCLNEMECRAQLPGEVEKVITRYVAECEGEAADVRLPWSYVEKHILTDTYLETRDVNISPTERQPVVILHALLRFDHQANAMIRDAALRGNYARRALATAAGFGGVLWLLSLVWAYLRIDIATKGRYRGRLRLALAAVIAVPAVAAVLLIA